MENTKRDYSKYFTDKKFWDKVLKFGKSAGVKVTYTALILYYTIQKPLVPAKAKAVVYGALGYFIFPLDLIPDVIPVAGYADDIGMLLGALAIIAMYIDSDSKQQARNKIFEWFGESVIDEVASIDEEIEKKKKKSEDRKS